MFHFDRNTIWTLRTCHELQPAQETIRQYRAALIRLDGLLIQFDPIENVAIYESEIYFSRKSQDKVLFYFGWTRIEFDIQRDEEKYPIGDKDDRSTWWKRGIDEKTSSFIEGLRKSGLIDSTTSYHRYLPERIPPFHWGKEDSSDDKLSYSLYTLMAGNPGHREEYLSGLIEKLESYGNAANQFADLAEKCLRN
ncbi:MAG: hypothetical protein V1740_04155 [Candidatus Woesearchaeota archaeon]